MNSMRRGLLGAAALCVAGGGGYFGLSYFLAKSAFFCAKASAEETEYSALTYYLNNVQHKGPIFDSRDGVKDADLMQYIIPYHSVEDLLASNADCCEFKTHDLNGPLFTQYERFQGVETALIIESKERIALKSGRVIEHVTTRYVAIDRCGHVVENVGAWND